MAGASAVIIDPESEIGFRLTNGESTPKATIKLKHPGGSTGAVAFKVRLSRRVLVVRHMREKD